MTSPGLRVIKLGGSVLESADWTTRFSKWYSALPASRTLLLVGGGPPVDAIRQVANMSQYDEEFLHWLCIDAMDISYRLVEQKLGRCWQALRSAQDLRTWLDSPDLAAGLVHVNSFYSRQNYRELPIVLPLSWSTTSDSLAATLARVVQADELILIKSCSVPEPLDWNALAQQGVVDQAFPQAASALPRVIVSTM